MIQNGRILTADVLEQDHFRFAEATLTMTVSLMEAGFKNLALLYNVPGTRKDRV